MSTHEARVIRLPKFQVHPQADNLALVEIFGYTVVINKHQWKEGDLAAYIEPDYTVKISRPEFSFLDSGKGRERERITVKKLRGIYSQGLLVPVSEEQFKEGDNALEALEIERYEPPMEYTTKCDAEKGPEGIYPKYDVENWQKYKHLFKDGEEVIITEKIHGASSRFKFHNDRMYCGSRTQWKKEDSNSGNLWWNILKQNSWIEEFCREYPNLTLYGEVYGWVQDLRYDHKPGQISFRIFDIWDNRINQYMDYELIYETFLKTRILNMIKNWVPILFHGPYSEKTVQILTDGRSEIASCIREGCVIKPVKERYKLETGRLVLKSVSNKYLEKSR